MRFPLESLALAGATLTCLVVPAVPGYWLPAPTRTAIAAAGLLLLPGAMFLRLIDLRAVRAGERLAVCFVASLAVVTVPWIRTIGSAGDLGGFFDSLLWTLAVLAMACAALESIRQGRTEQKTEPGAARAGGVRLPSMRILSGLDRGRSHRSETAWGVVAIIVALLVVDTLAAWKFTASSSIDRWWYLAYVRHWREAPAIDFREPFFGSGYVSPRFGFNVWLLSMAAWGDLAGADPVWLYERACPLLLIPVAFSALYFFARSIFESRAAARLTVVAGGLLWAGGTFIPAGTRIPEDKILAWLIVMPVSCGALIRMLDEASAGRAILLGACLAVQATVHPLVYALVLLVTVPYTALTLFRRQTTIAAAALAATLLAAGAVYPITTGMAARRALHERGADVTESAGNPIVRIHSSRNRLIELGNGLGFVVHPRLLARPILILALCCVPIVARRGGRAARFLLPATILPLAAAFVPPLPRLAGYALSPWMVYRLLWAIPFPLLLAAGLERAGAAWPRRQWLPLVVVFAAAAPWSAVAWQQRAAGARRALEVPPAGAFRHAMAALQAIPPRAVVAAPIEISERIPALAGRRVLATSDRGTLVFSPTIEDATARLHMRAEIFAGLPPRDRSHLLATHALFAPGAPAERACGRILFEEDGFVLCRLGKARTRKSPPPLPRIAREPEGRVLDLAQVSARSTGGPAKHERAAASRSFEQMHAAHTRRSSGARARPEQTRASSAHRAAATGGKPGQAPAVPEHSKAGQTPDAAATPAGSTGAEAGPLMIACDPPPEVAAAGHLLRWPRPGPWSARSAQVLCNVAVSPGGPVPSFLPAALTIEPATGRAREEFVIRVSGATGRSRNWVRVARAGTYNPGKVVLALPSRPVERLRIEITPTNLPFVKLQALRLTYR